MGSYTAGCSADAQKETGFQVINLNRGGLNGWHLVRLTVASGKAKTDPKC